MAQFVNPILSRDREGAVRFALKSEYGSSAGPRALHELGIERNFTGPAETAA
jgi:hypothetical protein